MPLTANTTTIKVSPTALNPTYNETIVVLESTNVAQENFQWVIEIWVDGLPNGLNTTLISTLVILPNPEGFGVIDVQRHVENYINTTFQPADLDTIGTAEDSYRIWSLNVTEYFDNYVWTFDRHNTNGGKVVFINDTEDHFFEIGDEVNIAQTPVPTYPAYDGETTVFDITSTDSITIDKAGITALNEPGVATGNKTVEVSQTTASSFLYKSFNGVIDFADFNSFNLSLYDMDVSNPTALFLTDLPNNYDIRRDDPIWLNGYSESNGYNLFNVVTDNGQFTIYFTTAPSVNDSFIIQSKVGYNDLLNSTSGVIVVSGALPMVDPNTTFISVNAVGGVSKISEVKTFNIVDKCSKYENIKLFFLDRLGSYIPLNFDRVNRTNVTNERSNYKQNYGNYDTVANAWGYTTHARGTTTYDIKSTKSVTCTSDWLNDEQVELMHILLTSPDVYYIDEAGVYRAITITTNSFEEKKRVNDKLLNYTITFEYANNNGNQRG